MIKKWFCVLLCLVLLMPAGCKRTGFSSGDIPWKIAIVTGDENEGEAIYAANQLKNERAYIETRVFPGDKSREKTVSICTELAQDPLVRAIVFVPAVAGIDEAARAVKEKRPDILFVAGAETVDAGFVAQTADLVLAQDMYTMGTEVIDEAYRMGAKKFIHYTFARHLLSEPVIRRREIMVERCRELGIDFMDITTPDPLTAEGGKEEARQFIEEDVPQQVGDYGANTAFFATDCTIAAVLITKVMECGAIYPQQCCPGPFHGYPEALGIDVGDRTDAEGVINQIAKGIAPYGNTGRMAIWPVSPDMLMVQAGVEYAVAYCEGEIEKGANQEKMQSILDTLTKGRTQLRAMGHAPNCLLFIAEYYML